MNSNQPIRPNQTWTVLFSGLRRFCAAVVILFCATLTATGQSPATNGANSVSNLVAQLQVRLSEARANASALSAASTGFTNLPPGATTTEMEEYRLMPEALARIYQDHIDQVVRLEESRQRQKDREQAIKAWTGFPEPGPYSILFIDELRDSLQTIRGNIAASETSEALLDTLSRDAGLMLKKSDERLRLLADQLEATKDATLSTRLAWQRTLETLRNRLSSARAALNETQRRKLEADLAEQRQHLALVQRQVAIASQSVRFSQADLDLVLGSLKTQQGALEMELRDAEQEFENRQRDLSAVRTQLNQALQSTSGTGTNQTPRDTEIRRLQALVELRDAQTETSGQRLMVLRQLADAVFTERGMWQMRFTTFHTEDLSTLREGYQKLDQLGRLIRSVKPHFMQQIENAANLVTEQRNRIQNRAAMPADPQAAEELLNTFREREELARRVLRALDKAERFALRWQESLDADRLKLPVTERVRDLFGEFSTFTSKFWNFELFAAEDTITVDGQKITGRRTVTVGKVVLAVFILVVGYWLSLVLARLLERWSVRWFKVESNQARLIRRWVRVLLIIALVVFSLVTVRIPLTVFAFLGGALAIGLGFGTQNLLKNFISGIIILFERPFRVGDVLDIGGHRGTVINIGIRSSVIKLFDSTETLIPNSALLENNLTNWTYSDRKVRFSVSVGVAYGSDTRRVAQMLADAAARHGLVQKDPAPQVFFLEFGDNALTFELRFWVDVVQHNAAQVSSDLHHMIAATFTENGIVMAFPQRDLHLDTVRPLQVQILPPLDPRPE